MLEIEANGLAYVREPISTSRKLRPSSPRDAGRVEPSAGQRRCLVLGAGLMNRHSVERSVRDDDASAQPAD